MNICITSINYNNYTVLSNLTWPNKVEYALIHGYSHFHKKDRFKGHGLCLGFEKIFYIKNMMQNSNIDWIFFLGCDTLITNFKKKVEDIIALADAGECFIVGADVNGINMDSFLIKNDENGKNLIEMVWNSHSTLNHTWCYEQKWFWDNEQTYAKLIKVVPQRTLNSYDYNLYTQPSIDKTGNDGRWRPGDFIIHWPGMNLNKRLGQYEVYKNRIIK